MNAPPLAGGTCTIDGARTRPGATLCPAHIDKLTDLLRQAPDVADDLEIAITRQDRIGTPAGRRSTEQPLPYNPAAAAMLTELRDVVDRIARAFVPPWDTAPGVLGNCGQLHHHLQALIGHADAGYAWSALHDVLRRARRVCDRPADRWYAGPCWAATTAGPCPADLYAEPGAPTVTCTACGLQHDTTKRRAFLLEQVEDQLRNATALARALSGLGVEVTPERIRKWAQRGRITPHGHDTLKHPTYRVGDVLDLVQTDLRARNDRRRSA